VDQVTTTRRRTQAERRAATRTALLDAAVDCLIEEGYAGLTTRRVAERAGVAQSTQMHYFPSRESFIVAALRHVAERIAREAIEAVDLSDLKRPEKRAVVLDRTWEAFTSPISQAAVQLWVAAYTEPELRRVMLDVEATIRDVVAAGVGVLFGDEVGKPGFDIYVDGALALIRGLALDYPVIGPEASQRRWEALRPVLVDLAAQTLD
jgi:AcrR family transcriptional regulator